MIAEWAAGYVGIPYRDHGRDSAGVDCWGLVRLVLSDVFKTELPCMASSYLADARDQLSDLIVRNIEDRKRVRLEAAKAGDVLFFAQGGHVSHCGIVAGKGFMLHAREAQDVVLEIYERGLWARRLHGIFRHENLQ